MTEFFGSVWWLIVSLGILVTFHEFGHYWVARRCGVRVLRFSVGFGRPLWTRLGKDGTEYVIAMLPLGGYVKMLDEREVEVAPHERHESFNAKPVFQRIAIVAAGPVANLLLCIGLLWLMFVVGKPDFLPEVGRAEGLAAEAGFRPGDRLLAAGDREIRTWTEANIVLAAAAIDREPLALTVRGADGDEVVRTLPLDRPGLALDEKNPIGSVGLVMAQFIPPAIVGQVEPGSAAEGRLQPGDRILAIGGQPVADYNQISPALQAQAAPGRTVTLRIEREGRVRDVDVDPRLIGEGPEKRWILGRSRPPPSRTPCCASGRCRRCRWPWPRPASRPRTSWACCGAWSAARPRWTIFPARSPSPGSPTAAPDWAWPGS